MEILLRSWRTLAVRGVIAILFSGLVLIWPDLTLLALTALFAAYALFTGMVLVAGAVKSRKDSEDWWLLLLIGLVSVGAGVIAIVHPAMTALVLVLVVGANALVSGVLDIVFAIRLRKTIQNEGLMIVNGLVAILFGVMVFLFPGAGALALLWLISLYAFVSGVLLLALAWRLRARAKTAAESDRRVRPNRRIPSAQH